MSILVLLHPRPSADGFECWFLRQTAALFHLRHTYGSFSAVSVSHPPSIASSSSAATERADQGWQPHKGPQRVLPGLTRALTGHRGRLTRNECSLNDVVTPPGGAHCVGIITHRSSNPICGMRRVNPYSVVRLCNVMNSPLPLARLRQYVVNIKCA